MIQVIPESGRIGLNVVKVVRGSVIMTIITIWFIITIFTLKGVSVTLFE
jgi:hypothetical protein